MQKFIPWVIGATVVFGWGLYNKSAQARKEYTDCVQTDTFSTQLHARCTCYAKEIANELPFSYYLPVVGPVFFSPTQLEIDALFKANISQCSR